MRGSARDRRVLRLQRALRPVGFLGVVVGCVGMASMLPGVAASILGAAGLTGSSLVGRALAPVAEPLFIVSAALLVLGALACSRLPTALATGGAVLLYLGMWVLPSAGSPAGSMGAMTSAQGGAARADAATFWTGVALVVASFALSGWRRRRRRCRPFVLLHAPPGVRS